MPFLATMAAVGAKVAHVGLKVGQVALKTTYTAGKIAVKTASKVAVQTGKFVAKQTYRGAKAFGREVKKESGLFTQQRPPPRQGIGTSAAKAIGGAVGTVSAMGYYTAHQAASHTAQRVQTMYTDTRQLNVAMDLTRQCAYHREGVPPGMNFQIANLGYFTFMHTQIEVDMLMAKMKGFVCEPATGVPYYLTGQELIILEPSCDATVGTAQINNYGTVVMRGEVINTILYSIINNTTTSYTQGVHIYVMLESYCDIYADFPSIIFLSPQPLDDPILTQYLIIDAMAAYAPQYVNPVAVSYFQKLHGML